MLPFVLGFGGLPLLLSVTGGVGLIIYSALTDYDFGCSPLLSFRAHLALDIAAAAVFVLAPFAFGWTGLVLGYYLVMAAGVVIVVALTQPQSAPDALPASSQPH